MKKINILFGLLVGTLTFTSCSDSFLEQDPPTKAPADEYFKGQEHIQEALNAVYSPLRVYDYFVNSNGGMYCPLPFSDVMGDDMLVGASGPTDQEVWHRAFDYDLIDVNTVWAIWDNSYHGVRIANEAISYVENDRANLPADFAASTEAEARVMRAYYYGLLWKYYGNIPYFTEKLNATAKVEQLGHDEVYNKIIEDLEGAIAMNALPMRQTVENYGRATQAMAYMIYAELVMYQNDASRFSTALGYMQQIIQSGLYDLDTSYAHLWSPDGEWGPETIFDVNYIDGPSAGRSYPDDNDPYKSGNYVIGGTIMPRVLAPQGGVAADGVQDGWGTFIPRKSAYEMYANNDERRDVSCYVAPEGGYTPRYQDQGLFCGKYVARNSHTSEGTGGASDMVFNDNLRIYRYAETLLNAAELLVRTNGDLTLAKSYITKVRKRAGLVSEVEPTLDNIIQERRLEFLGEGKRYWDLVRMEGVSGVTTKASTVLKAEPEAVNAKGEPGRTHNWTPNKKYIPISFIEISAAEGGLVQNNDYFN